MLIKCPQCNHDNQLGAIFCRSCGAKLDVETIRPKVIDHRSSDWDLFGIIRRLVSLAVLAGLIGVLVMMFMPSPEYAKLAGEDQVEAAKIKFDELTRRLDGGFGKDVYVFSPQEATFLYNDKFIAAPGAGANAYNIESLTFHLDHQGYTHLRLGTKLGGSIPATFEIKGFLKDGEEGLGLTVTKAKMGRMGMPSVVNRKILEKFMPGLDGEGVQRILAATARIEVQDGQYVLTLKQ